jgi:hypothetical protein
LSVWKRGEFSVLEVEVVHRFALGHWVRHNISEEVAKIVDIFREGEGAIYSVIIPIDQASLMFEFGAILADWRDSEVASASATAK